MALMGPTLDAAFKACDADGSGALDRQELRLAFEKAGTPYDEATITSTMQRLDANGDGLVDRDEFRQLASMLAFRSAPECSAVAIRGRQYR